MTIERVDAKEKVSRKNRILVMASGGGTNFQEIINNMENGKLNANIVGLLSDNPEAGALMRARNHGIEEIVVSSTGRKKRNSVERSQFEQELVEEINKRKPDLIVLAGWMMILNDPFLEEMQKQSISVINLHPALLTESDDYFYQTSIGTIPVVRGAHAISDAFGMNLKVSGVTVHEVLPGRQFDTGPIVMQKEVYRNDRDNVEDWEKRIHEAEYQVLPQAIAKKLEELNNG